MAVRYYPKLYYINAITNAVNAKATFTADHDFTAGQIVSFRVSTDFGMRQLNNRRAKVLSTTSDTITVNIDSSEWDAFTYANLDAAGTTPPICIPSASGVEDNTVIPSYNIKDAFDKRNIS